MIAKDIKIKLSCWCSLSSSNILAKLQATVVSRWWDQWILSPDTSLLLTIEPEIFEHSWWLPVLPLSWHCVVYEPIDVVSLLAVHLSSLFRPFICLYNPLPFAKIPHLLDKRHKWERSGRGKPEGKWAERPSYWKTLETTRHFLLLLGRLKRRTDKHLISIGRKFSTFSWAPQTHFQSHQI